MNPLVDQPLDMAVGQLCRVAFGFRGNGFHAQLVDLPVGEGGKHHPEAQFPEEGGPEGIVFIHIQHSGNANGAPESLLLG